VRSELRRVHHIGVLVEDATGTGLAFAELLGLEVESTERYADELDIAFLPCGETLVELIEPLTGLGWNAEDLSSKGPHIQHVAFEVDDLATVLHRIASKGVATVGEAPRPGAGGTTIAFLDPSHFGGILVELVEVPPADPVPRS
jgi:methylmalonyl-CoA epimerase